MNAQTIVETVVPISTSCAFGHGLCPRGPFCSQYILIKETEITAEICFNILFIIIIAQIVLIIVAAYFTFRAYSCVYTISAAFAQFCALQVSIRSYLNRILICYRSLQIQGGHPIEYVERNVKILFYFSLIVKCKKYSSMSSTSHPPPMYLNRCY